MTTVTEHRYIFRRITQGKNQKFMDFFCALRKQAKFCEFSNEKSQIYDQIVAETSIKELRYRAFESEMNLDELVELARRLECHDKECTRCGSVEHRYFEIKICPAFKNKCKECYTFGHYDEFCFKRLNNPRKRSSMESFRESPQKFVKVKVEKQDLEIEERLRSMQKDEGKKPPGVEKSSSDETVLRAPSETSFLCTIGDVTAQLVATDEFTVNVITKKFFDTHRIKCVFHSNKSSTIDGHNYTCQLETRVDRDGRQIPVEFFFSEKIEEEECFVTLNVARKLGVKIKI